MKQAEPPGRRQRRTAPSDEIDVSRLPTLDVESLRRLWASRFPRATPPPQRRLLIRELAWRIQAAIHGDLDRSTRRLLARAIKEATQRFKSQHDARSGDAKGNCGAKVGAGSSSCRPKRRVRVISPGLSSGSRLLRVWRGVRHEVDVGGDGVFRYRGQAYSSLSEIARLITGTRWSGPRFFGMGRGSDASLGRRATP